MQRQAQTELLCVNARKTEDMKDGTFKSAKPCRKVDELRRGKNAPTGYLD